MSTEKLKPTALSDIVGDKENGIIARYLDDDLDEIVMYVGGECVMHMEGMSESSIWFGLYPLGHAATFSVISVSGRAKIAAVNFEAD